MLLNLLAVLFSSTQAPALPRTLVERSCPRWLVELTEEAEDPKALWAPLPRVTDEELSLVNGVAADAAAIEAFAQTLFPGLRGPLRIRMMSFFDWMWQRLPEYSHEPTFFPSEMERTQIVKEWRELVRAFNRAPRRHLTGGIYQPEGPTSLRIAFDPSLRANLGKVDTEIRRAIETTAFLPADILRTLTIWTDEEDFAEEGGLRLAFRRMWRRTLGVEQPPDYAVVESLDGTILSAKGSQILMGARIVEDFRLYKMVYNRNRPKSATYSR